MDLLHTLSCLIASPKTIVLLSLGMGFGVTSCTRDEQSPDEYLVQIFAVGSQHSWVISSGTKLSILARITADGQLPRTWSFVGEGNSVPLSAELTLAGGRARGLLQGGDKRTEAGQWRIELELPEFDEEGELKQAELVYSSDSFTCLPGKAHLLALWQINTSTGPRVVTCYVLPQLANNATYTPGATTSSPENENGGQG